MPEPGFPVPPGAPRDRVTIEYIKSQYFRVIHADGAIGGVTPGGNLHFALFSERPAIPRRVVTLLEGERFGANVPEETVVREGLIREMDVDVILTLAAAEELGKLLLRMASDARVSLEQQTKKTHEGA